MACRRQAYGVYAEEINAHFQGLFPNREEFVFHELLSDLVHIDVNIMRPDETHPYYVMYTTGMSDMPMTLPEEIAGQGGPQARGTVSCSFQRSGIREKPASSIPTLRRQ
ncbi:MAG: suppressor of fused domain protein [Enterocloster bolteae]